MPTSRTALILAPLALVVATSACIDPIEYLLPIDRPDGNVWLVPWAEFLGGLVIDQASNP